MIYKCVGCDGHIPWDGKGELMYTCPCGATLFYNVENLNLVMPASLVHAITRFKEGLEPEAPHIDYYVGYSSHTSELKELIVEGLLEIGVTWMKDCKQCLGDGTYARELDREKREIVDMAERIIGGEDTLC